jgi:hypothetical protein
MDLVHSNNGWLCDFLLQNQCLPDLLGRYCVDGVSGLEGGHPGIEPPACETQVADDVEQFVAAAFVREMQLEVAQVAVLSGLEARKPEQAAEVVYLLLSHRMLDDDDGIADISSFNESLAGEEFYFMEEYEGPARSDGGCLVGVEVPAGILHAKYLGPEIDG